VASEECCFYFEEVWGNRPVGSSRLDAEAPQPQYLGQKGLIRVVMCETSSPSARAPVPMSWKPPWTS